MAPSCRGSFPISTVGREVWRYDAVASSLGSRRPVQKIAVLLCIAYVAVAILAPRVLPAKCRPVPQVKSPPLPSTSFPFNYSLTLQTFDVFYADCLINHHSVKRFGRLEAELHALLISSLNVGEWSSFRMRYSWGNMKHPSSGG